MNHLLPALEFLRRKTNFTDEEEEIFQVEFDIFFQDWVKLWDQKATSSCIYMCQTVHVSKKFIAGEIYASVLNKVDMLQTRL